MRWVLRLLGALVAVLVLLFAWTWSWTFTEEGRMDYRAALMARLISMQAQRELVMNAETRKRSNENTVRWLGEREMLPVAEIRDISIPGPAGDIPARVYIPHADSDGPLPLYLMIHGGGFWMGNDFRIEEPQARRISSIAQVIVVAVDYRLAPEHPYPAALEDCYAALEWLFQHGASLGGDPQRIAVGGGSAGGNLSAAVALKARDQGGPKLSFLLLTVPSTDLSGGQNLHEIPAVRRMVLTADHVAAMREAYVPDEALRRHPYVSPLLAEDHRGLPPTYVITADFDPLRDQGEALGEKIRDAGGEVTIKRYPGVLHGFLGTPDVADQAISEAVREMRAVLARNPVTRQGE